MVGDKDTRAADLAAKRLLREAEAVPLERKLFVRALSDDHGFPALTATLAAPGGARHRLRRRGDQAGSGAQGRGKEATKPPPFRWSADMALTGEQQTLVSQINVARVDALDYLGFWKTFDLAAAAAFARLGRHCAARTMRGSPTWSAGATAGLSSGSRWKRPDATPAAQAGSPAPAPRKR